HRTRCSRRRFSRGSRHGPCVLSLIPLPWVLPSDKIYTPVRMYSRYAPLLISVKPYIMHGMPRKEKPFPIDLLFRVLADRTRLRLLNLIADKEICVCYFVEILRISQPKISRHLAYLRRAGIVAARRQGRWMHYRLLAPRDAVASAILKETLAHL